MSERFGSVLLPELVLHSGKILKQARVAYSINGTPRSDGSNVVVVCHALTGSHHVAGESVSDLPEAWWDPLVRPGGVLDTDKLCVVCCNNLCSPYGSSAPTDIEPGTHRPWGMHFPLVDPRDIAHSQKMTLDALGIPRVAGVIGGSLGAMIALEWMSQFGATMDFGISIAAPLRLYPQAIALNGVQRRAITSDPQWLDGNYYPGRGPVDGLFNARMLAMITYRSEESFVRRHMRASHNIDEWGGRFDVESYLMHQGKLLTRRFDANCYLYLTKMMDLHDLAKGYADAEAALEPMRKKPFLAVGINSDILFPPWQVQEVVDAATDVGVRASYRELRSDIGHDAFLVETGQLAEIFKDFFDSIGFLEQRPASRRSRGERVSSVEKQTPVGFASE
ncbi:MAG: homoserine O-acetyltransferase [Synergistaceae bacterium]|jgi:homoserine O-acetyltransferase|nr:homoserine O-acetyltransferase [Synergistaceae bacterium]